MAAAGARGKLTLPVKIPAQAMLAAPSAAILSKGKAALPSRASPAGLTGTQGLAVFFSIIFF